MTRCRLASLASLALVLVPLACGGDGSANADGSSSSGDAESSSDTSTPADSSSGAAESSTGELCGNGVVDEGEKCDGTDFDGNTCESQGFLHGELACTGNCKGFSTAGCVVSECGDGMITGNELCDGELLGDATCVTQGFLAGTLACRAGCDGFDTDQCDPNICGNGTIESPEDCDGEALADTTCVDLGFDEGTLGCQADCTFATFACISYTCGDGSINGATEQCDGADIGAATCADGGYGPGTVGCTESCTLDFTGCCGDGNQGGAELCDGTDFAGETCASQGDFDDGPLACAPGCDAIDTSACTLCGDGVAEGNEGCDAADLLGQDCTSVPGGFVAGTLSCSPSCQLDTSDCNYCGNAIIDAGEDCDGEFLGVPDCLALGHTGGLLACAADCGYDESLCTDYPAPAADELVIVEIMRDPTAVPDPNGEWFELYNPGAATYQLYGCTFHDDGADSFDVGFDLLIGPGASLTFARSPGPGFTPDYVYTGMTLGNGDDALELACGGVTVDRVAWSNATFPAPVGASMQLDPLATSTTDNDDGGNWCAASSVYFMGDRGTPGTDNDGC